MQGGYENGCQGSNDASFVGSGGLIKWLPITLKAGTWHTQGVKRWALTSAAQCEKKPVIPC